MTSTHIYSTLLAAAVTLGTSAAFAETAATGVADLAIADSSGNRPLEGMIWYPTADTTPAQRVHNNAVWEGIMAVPDAAPTGQGYPLVVLSHGMYGNTMNQSWLADALVARGFVVAAVNHPGTSSWMRDPDQSRQLWERPRDVSRVIDHLTGDAMPGLIDPDRIYMGGHSLGGFTALALAGGLFDPEAFDAFCASQLDELVCGIWDRWNVAKTDEDRVRMSADLSDPRIKGFAVFDLGGTQTFSPESLGAIDSPMLVMGAPLDISGLNLDIESRALVAAMPDDNVTYLEPATLSHFDFMGVCTPAALDILKAEEPDDVIVCLEGRDQRRVEHAWIAETVAAFFGN